MAQDRLWQLEMWRRWREGRLAEIYGAKAIDFDERARLMAFRGPWDEKEWSSYHPDAERLFTAWANGLNAWVAQNADNLPVEFKLTGIKPEPWTAKTLTLRWAEIGLDSAANTPAQELRLAMDVAKMGAAAANKAAAPDPWDDLTVPEGLDLKLITNDVIAAVNRGDGNPFGPDATAAARDRPRISPSDFDAAERARVERAAGRGRQQQLGGQRQALADGRADRVKRSASNDRDAVAPLLRPSRVSRMERHWRHRAAVFRCRRRQQREHGLGLHLRRHRHGRHVRRGDEPRGSEPDDVQRLVGAA